MDFIRDFQPYRSKYSKQIKIDPSGYLFSGYGYEWRTIHRFLKTKYIEQALLGRAVIGWFTKTTPNILGIDIDDHQGKAWSGATASPLLLSLYRQITTRLPEPSVLVQSPRGLHCYWLLRDRIPADILRHLAKNKVAGIPCEIRPTPDLSLRIPEKSRVLNPTTLLPEPNREVVKYHPCLLFDDTYLPERIRDTLQERKGKLRSFQYSAKIQTVEALYTPIVPGYSNDTLNALMPVYRRAGLTAAEAIYRITLILQQSPLYQGELRNPRRLEQRIKSYYRKDLRSFIPQERVTQLNLLHKPLVDDLVNESPYAPQRNRPIERFLYSLLNWCEWHDEIVKNPRWLAYCDYLYPYYRKNRKEGYYPLPQSFLRKANSMYDRRYKQEQQTLIEWLQSTGFLVRAPYKYVPGAGICTYYKIRKGEPYIHI